MSHTPRHTIGPWECDFDDASEAAKIIDKNCRTVATCEGGSRVSNARLIAAAPELLEACQSILAAADDILTHADKSTNAGSAAVGAAVLFRDLVASALSKATTQQSNH